MEKVTFFFKNGHFIECNSAGAVELAVSMLTYNDCDLMVITDDDGSIYPIELTPLYKMESVVE